MVVPPRGRRTSAIRGNGRRLGALSLPDPGLLTRFPLGDAGGLSRLDGGGGLLPLGSAGGPVGGSRGRPRRPRRRPRVGASQPALLRAGGPAVLRARPRSLRRRAGTAARRGKSVQRLRRGWSGRWPFRGRLRWFAGHEPPISAFL